MKIKLKTFAVLALVVSVIVVSGCTQPAQNATSSSTPAAVSKITSQEDAAKSVLDTSKDVKAISDTLADIDKTLAGK